MSWTSRRRTGILIACALAAGSLAAAATGVDPDLLAGLAARSIGPAGMSGRVASIDAVASDPDTIWVGAATGGVWKSTNGGLTWKPVFDDQPVAAIGAVTVFQPNPDVVWVGTGEGNPRNSVSVGNGVYRSLDGGETWTHLGLDRTERIHRIVLHPTDPDVAWVAALGRAWGENPERGVYRTADGGKTWTRVLYVDERTGAADLVQDPHNPRKLFAAMWDYRRWPWFFRSGGPGSGLFVTVDGGDHWKRLTPEDGLPEGELGRIGVAIAPSDPRVIYALIEAEENALYRSRDGGKSWEKTAAERLAGNRPFYYADLRVDPQRPNRVYSLWSVVSVSDDGGESFRILVPFRAVHPDHHAMWIDPAGGRRILLGNDGGVAASRDRGATWRFVANLPLAQYYHVAVDDDVPYHVYGGMQDNGSWRGPSRVWENGGIRNHHWEEVGFGDGFDTQPDPLDSTRGYAMSQEGYLNRWNLRSGERKDIRPPAPPGVELRFSWNAALALDPFDPATLYYGSQFVHRSTDRGESWEIVSDDLTTNDPEHQRQKDSGGLTPDVTGAENFTTITTIAPSPVERGVIWAGTDDGRIHVTRDGGRSWTSVESRLRGAPAGTWVPHIEASPHAGGTAFVVLDDHRRSNLATYLYRTTDHGRSWKSLAGDDDLRGYGLVVEQDPVDAELLFFGTEFGLYVSLDGGADWLRFEHGLPTVAVRDLVVHPREHDLVIGTHGRAAFVLDDVRPLRTVSGKTLERPLEMFEAPAAQQYRVRQTGASRFPGHGEFRGTNRPYGALITFSMNVPGLPHPDEERERERKARLRAERAERGGEGEGAEDETADEQADDDDGDDRPKAVIRISDATGATIRTMEQPVSLGLNRVAWDLRRDAFREPPREEPRWSVPRGPEVLPGEYGVAVEYGEHRAEGRVLVLADPRVEIATGFRERKLAAILRAGRLQELVADAVSRVRQARTDTGVVLDKADAAVPQEAVAEERENPHAALIERGRRLRKSLDRIERRLWKPPATKGIVADDDALSAVSYALGNLGSSWDAPTAAQTAYVERAEARLGEALAALNELFAGEVAGFRRAALDAGLTLFPEAAPLELD